jgi:maltoporin
VLTVGFTLAVAGQAHAQTAPADSPAPADNPPGAPAPAVAEANPLAASQLEQVRKEIAAAPKLIEFHGYVRAGFGVNSKGGDQDPFQAPGAGAKYRLGNETETYGEAELDNNWVNPDHTDTWFKTVILLAFVAPRNNTFDTLNTIAFRQAFAEAGKVIASHPEMTFWAGQRFYRRRDVHINDFFFNDTSGYGAGFQGLKIGSSSSLSIAYLGGSVEYGPTDPQSDLGRFAKNTFDIRLSDLPVGNGKVELLLLPVLAATGTSIDPARPVAENRSGIAAGVFHNLPFMGGFNEVSAQFGIGGAANLSPGMDQSIGPNGWLLRVVERAVIQASPQLSMMWTGVFQLDNRNGSTNGSTGNLWFSAGARPVYNFTKYTGIAIEGGIDVVKPEASSTNTGFLGKLTVAPLIRPGTDFWARPEIRAYVTTAFWNDTIKGAVGGPAYATDTFGLTAGVQMESWW